MQGMMNELPPQAAPQGQQPSQRFNGVVTYQDQPINVVDGRAEFEGETYLFSNDGSIVANRKQQIVGVVQNGKFMPSTPEIVDQLKQAGIVK